MEKTLVQRILELCDAPIYVGSSTTDLQKEIAENCWSISTSQQECEEANVADLLVALDAVVACRRQQVAEQASGNGAIFYCWFDEQACQLRICVISGLHSKLPFRRAITRISTAESIIGAFLASRNHDGIPWDEFEEAEFSEVETKELQPLDVFIVRLP